jgi:predicted N-acetyltransferase YhbS
MRATAPDPPPADPDILIRPMREADLPEADRIFRLAFGTFIGFPDPMAFAAGCELIAPRFRHDSDGMYVAEIDGRVAGSAIANRWGSVGFFGPLTVDPKFWDRRVGRRLMEPCVDTFERWGCTQVALFTFPHSTKHVALYQKFGFWPRFLTALMSKPVEPATTEPFKPSLLSALSDKERTPVIAECREIANQIYPGLDLTEEIAAVMKQKLGDVVLVRVRQNLEAFAICHFGLGTEGGPDRCYVKFGGVRPGLSASAHFDLLLDGCEQLAVAKKLKCVFIGISTACHETYSQMITNGYRADYQGLGMHRDNNPGHSRPGLYVLNDWR